MTHRVEQIMVAVKAAITGLATTGPRVYRGRAYSLGDQVVPCLLLFQGEDDVLEKHTPDRIESRLVVSIEAVAVEDAGTIETKLNQMRLEVNRALAVDSAGENQLDLPNVVDFIHEIGTQEPVLTGDATQVTGRLVMVFEVDYDRSRADPEI